MIDYGDIIIECKHIDCSGMPDVEMLEKIVYEYNILSGESDVYFPMPKKTIRRLFGWSFYKIRKVAKRSDKIVTTFMRDDEGYLCGRGYVIKSLM